MLVRERDRIQVERLAGRHRRDRAHQRAGPRVDVNLREPIARAEPKPHPAGRANLPRDNEARPTGTEKPNRDHLPTEACSARDAMR